MAKPVFENRAKKRLAAGELTLCMGVNQMRSPDVALIAAACGFDAIFIDLEHAPTSLESAAAICVSALSVGITPIARVASKHAHDSARILDAGGQGVMVAHIDNAEEARAIVNTLRFPPIGHRSAYGTGPALGYRPIPQGEVNFILNENELLIAMLETPEAIENAEAIAAVPGIDVVHIGSLDVTNEMGIPADYRNPRMWANFERVAKACRANGKAMGVGGARGDFGLQKDLIALGVRYMTTGSDVSYLMAAARSEVASLRNLKI